MSEKKPSFSVVEWKAACPQCGSTSRQKAHRSRTIPCHRMIQGIDYHQVTIAYTRCKKCGQVYVLRTYK